MRTVVHEIHCHDDGGTIAGRLTSLQPGDAHPFAFLPLQGTVTSKGDPIVAVLGRTQGSVLGGIPVVPTPTGESPGSSLPFCGTFEHRLNLLDLPPSFELHIDALTAQQSHVPLFTIRGERTSLASQSEWKPLLMSALGRTGSTVISHVLHQHPEVVAFHPFSFEARAAEYWIEVLRNLARPSSHLQIIAAEYTSPDWWVGERQPPPLALVPAPDILPFLAGSSIQRLARFCRTQTERFYVEHRKQLPEKTNSAMAFLEKGSGNRRMMRLAQEVWPRARQFFLVRDLRDMFASMLAYNRKHDRQQFGRQNAESDLALATNLRVAISAFADEWREQSAASHLMRYEDFVRTPEETLTALLRYLELPSDIAIVRSMIESGLGARQDSQARHRTTESAEASIGRYAKDLTPELIRACEDSFGDLNRELGYGA